jgi:hypothetical protein
MAANVANIDIGMPAAPLSRAIHSLHCASALDGTAAHKLVTATITFEVRAAPHHARTLTAPS